MPAAVFPVGSPRHRGSRSHGSKPGWFPNSSLGLTSGQDSVLPLRGSRIPPLSIPHLAPSRPPRAADGARRADGRTRRRPGRAQHHGQHQRLQRCRRRRGPRGPCAPPAAHPPHTYTFCPATLEGDARLPQAPLSPHKHLLRVSGPIRPSGEIRRRPSSRPSGRGGSRGEWGTLGAAWSLGCRNTPRAARLAVRSSSPACCCQAEEEQEVERKKGKKLISRCMSLGAARPTG